MTLEVLHRTLVAGAVAVSCALPASAAASSESAHTAAKIADAGPDAALAGTTDTAPSAVRRLSESGVSLAYEVPDKIAVGETVQIRLRLAGVTASDGASVEVHEVATRRPLLSIRLEKGEQRVVELSFTAKTDGLQYLDVTTRQAGRISVRSVPLRVGSGRHDMKQEGKRVVTPKGERLISLPAGKPASR